MQNGDAKAQASQYPCRVKDYRGNGPQKGSQDQDASRGLAKRTLMRPAFGGSLATSS